MCDGKEVVKKEEDGKTLQNKSKKKERKKESACVRACVQGCRFLLLLGKEFINE